MKDYTLSEIKNHDRNKDWEVCDDELLSPLEIARLRDIHDDILYTNIEPRDMIELPCKISVHSDNESFWQVAYRGLTRSGIVIVTDFSEESEADAFLADLKDLLKGRKQ